MENEFEIPSLVTPCQGVAMAGGEEVRHWWRKAKEELKEHRWIVADSYALVMFNVVEPVIPEARAKIRRLLGRRS